MVKFSLTSFVATTLAFAATATTAQVLPSCDGNTIADIACNPDGDFTTLCAAVTAADLAGALSSVNATFTVWAPTNDAFAALPDGTVDFLLTDEGLPALKNILLIHVAAELISPAELTCGGVVDTLGEPSSTFTECLTLGNTIQTGSNGADFLPQYILPEPVAACNGLIYPITNVIIPSVPATDEPTPEPTKKMKKTKKGKKD